jgi:uncharacterized membrane protein YgdD (TMEM256/DUF423 family)
MRRLRFIIAAFACALGAAGVGSAAAAAHLGGGQLLDTAATFLMLHSTAVLAVLALAERAPRRSGAGFTLAALLLIAGMLLFCGDFALRALSGHGLFPMAAPSGGILLIAGWLAAGVAGALAAFATQSSQDRSSGQA